MGGAKRGEGGGNRSYLSPPHPQRVVRPYVINEQENSAIDSRLSFFESMARGEVDEHDKMRAANEAEANNRRITAKFKKSPISNVDLR